MRNSIKLGLAGLGLLGVLAGGSYCAAKKTNLFDSTIPINIRERTGELQTIQVPDYNRIKVPAFYCSRYVQNAAQDLFGARYEGANAWDRRYLDNLVGPLKNSDIPIKARDGTLIPGDLVAFFNPHSSHNNDVDMTGKKVDYTHLMLYLGLDQENNPRFSHLYGKKVGVVGMEYINKKGLEAKEQIRSREK